MMDLAAVSPAAERARRCQEYLEALEEERRKIEVFQRELPLSLHLVTQAIESYRKQMAVEMLVVGCAVPSEREALEISSEGAPVLEEFIPMKRSSSSDADGEEEPGDRRQHDHQHSGNGGHNDEDSSTTSRPKPKETTSENVPDWLKSVQLWSQQPDSHPLPREEKHTLQDMNDRRPSAVEPKKSTGAFHPFHPQKRSPPPTPLPPPPPPVEAAPVPAPAPSAPVTSSNSETRDVGVGSGGGGGGKSGCSGGIEKDGNPHRKSRRCWSPELHRRFLNALQHLGGSSVATPKRIRELMKVDSLTNDEVKSHLQKYRLHSRRPSPTSHANSGSAPPQQVVFVGGIWVPPPEYTAAAAAAAAAAATEGNPPCPPAAEIYAPVALVPAPKQHKQGKQQQQRPSRGRDEQCVADDGVIPSDSPATSSSSRTNTSGLAGRRR